MKRWMLLGIAGAALASPVPAWAVTTVLTFPSNICGPAGNQSCGNGSEIGQNYGDGVGVDVGHRAFLTATGVTSEPFLKYWSTNYGDLVGIVWGGAGAAGYTSEITFTALAGYEISLIGFDGGCYLNRASCQTFPYSVSAIGGGVVASGSLTPPSGGHDSALLNTAYSTSGYVLQWGPDGYDGGLDNIAFDVRAVGANGAVPEPATWAMMVMGFGTMGHALRRRRRAETRIRFA